MATKKKQKKTATKKTATKTTAKKKTRDTAEERALALPSELAEQNPAEPVAQLAALALRTAELGAPALSSLKKLAGFDAAWLTDLRPAVQLLNDAEAKWSAARARSRAGIAPARVRQGEALRKDLVDIGRYQLRADPVVQEQLDQVADGTGVADLAADLHRLAALVEAHGAVFAAGGAASDAAATAATLGNTLSFGVDPQDAAELQARRNRLFHLVKSDSGELRAALRFLWRKQPTKLAMLGHGYAAQLRRAKTKRSPALTPA